VSRSKLIDGAVALGALASTLVLLGVGDGDARDLDGLGVLLAALSTLPLALRRRGPLAVFAFTAGASAGLNALGYSLGPPIGPTVALFFVGLAPDEDSTSRRRTLAVVAALLAAHLGSVAVGYDRFPFPELLFGLVVWTGAWLAGERTRLRRQRLADLEERAVRAEREAEQQRRLAAAEERTRIARDLHDSAGHAINVILVQAGAARLLHERDPERSRDALATIEEVARDTIGEIDQLVRVLRDEPTRAPVGLAGLDSLVARHRSTGLEVGVEVSGSHRQLSPALDQAAFRIVQEALTNAARHGGGGGARILVAYAPEALELEVTNPASASDGAAAPGGLGLVGMRERAALLGGSIETELAGGRFRLRARLPYGAQP
jgi:signal transduction histidine kinase